MFVVGFLFQLCGTGRLVRPEGVGVKALRAAALSRMPIARISFRHNARNQAAVRSAFIKINCFRSAEFLQGAGNETKDFVEHRAER
jgi:hypothetical protein